MGEAVKKTWFLGMLLAIGGTFLFALKSIFIKLAYADGASVEQVLLFRMLLAAPFYIGVLVYLLKKKSNTRGAKSTADLRGVAAMLGLGFLGYYLASYLDLAGLAYISAQLERLTLFTYPTMIAVLAAFFLGEKLSGSIVFSLICCYLGLWVMYGQELEYGESEHVTLGVILVLGSALSYSLYVIFAKPRIQRYGSAFFTSVAMLGSTGFVLVHALALTDMSVFQASPIVWGYCGALAFLCTVLPSYMIAAAIGMIGATKTSILGTVGPVFTIGFAVFFLDEPFGWSHVVGVLLVLAGVSIVTRKKKRVKS